MSFWHKLKFVLVDKLLILQLAAALLGRGELENSIKPYQDLNKNKLFQDLCEASMKRKNELPKLSSYWNPRQASDKNFTTLCIRDVPEFKTATILNICLSYAVKLTYQPFVNCLERLRFRDIKSRYSIFIKVLVILCNIFWYL